MLDYPFQDPALLRLALTHRSLGNESGESFPSGPVIESTTWVKRGARWVAVLNQETPTLSK